jgi:hypothetical protein
MQKWRMQSADRAALHASAVLIRARSIGGSFEQN